MLTLYVVIRDRCLGADANVHTVSIVARFVIQTIAPSLFGALARLLVRRVCQLERAVAP
jgi:hypothetical protein